MRKAGLFIFGMILLVGMVSFVSAETFSKDFSIQDRQVGIVFQLESTFGVSEEQYNIELIELTPKNISFRIGLYAPLTTYPTPRTSTNKTHFLEVGEVAILNDPLFDAKSVKLLNIKFEENPCGNEGQEIIYCRNYVAR